MFSNLWPILCCCYRTPTLDGGANNNIHVIMRLVARLVPSTRDQKPYNSVQVMRIIRYIVKQTMETKVIPKFAVFPIFYNGKRPKIVTKISITLLAHDIFF